MAVPVATTIGAGTITSTNPLVITLTSAVAAGESIVLRIANRTNRTVSSVTDTAGNTYVERVDNSGGVGGIAIIDCLSPAALAVGATISITFSGSATAYAHACKLSSTCTYAPSSANGAAGNTANPSITTGASVAAESLAVGVLTWGATTNAGVQSGWVGVAEASYGTRRFEAHDRDVTSAGSQTFAPTGLGSSNDYNIAIAAYTSPAGGPVTVNETLAMGTTAAAGVASQHGALGSLSVSSTMAQPVAAAQSSAASMAMPLSASTAGQGTAQLAASMSVAVQTALTSMPLQAAIAAMALGATGGQAVSGQVTAHANTNLAAALYAALSDAQGSQTLDESIALALVATAAANAAVSAPVAIDMGAAVAAAVSAAITVATSMTFSAAAGADAAGRLVVEGSLTFGTDSDLSAASSFTADADLTFTAVFDAETSALLDAEAAIEIAVRSAVLAGVPTENEIVDVVALTGAQVLAVPLAGRREIAVPLSGKMTITVRLNGRLN